MLDAVRCTTANSGVADVSHVREAKAPFGVGDVVLTLWFQEKYTEKLAQRREEEVPPWAPHWPPRVLEHRSKGVTSP